MFDLAGDSSGTNVVDGGCMVQQSDALSKHHDAFDMATNAEADADIDQRCLPNMTKCPFRLTFIYNDTLTKRNALRYLYSEYRVGRFLSAHAQRFDVAIICRADLYLALDINVPHLHNAARNASFIYATRGNDGGGYTDGFFFGQPRALIPVLRRFEELPEFLSKASVIDYEGTLKHGFLTHAVHRKTTPMVFFKVRGDGRAVWQGLRVPAYWMSETAKDTMKSLLAAVPELQWVWDGVPRWLIDTRGSYGEGQGTREEKISVLRELGGLADPAAPRCSAGFSTLDAGRVSYGLCAVVAPTKRPECVRPEAG